MLSKKICMLGACSVGKTALVEQFVHSIFSDRYLTTLGVKISKKTVTIDEVPCVLILWDLEGKSEQADINTAYLRGAMGFFAVCDGTRRETLTEALDLRARALALLGADTPNILLVNKQDLITSQTITDAELHALEQSGIPVLRTSAKTGLNTAEAFISLARTMIASA